MSFYLFKNGKKVLFAPKIYSNQDEVCCSTYRIKYKLKKRILSEIIKKNYRVELSIKE